VRVATLWGVLLGSAALGGCSRYALYEKDQLLSRAAFDFSCPEEQLKVTKLGNRTTAGVEGCGKRATYVNDNDHWIMNSPSVEPGSAAPATSVEGTKP